MYGDSEDRKGLQGAAVFLMSLFLLSSVYIIIPDHYEGRHRRTVAVSVEQASGQFSSIEATSPSVHRGDAGKITLADHGFTPFTGKNGTIFNFTVTYTHVDGDEPGDHSIIIDSIFHDMELISGDPVVGSVYVYRTMLSMGIHDYRFFFGNVYFPEDDVLPGPRINSPPRLFWTMEEHYQNNGVFPTTGVSTDDFVFRIKYTDDDNDHPENPPGYLDLVLDGVRYSMKTVDENFLDGSIFIHNVSGLVPGEHQYYFECSDGFYLVRFPGVSDLSLPVINSRPELIVPRLPTTGGNELEGSVFPGLANSTDEFTFQIIYKDIDGHPPSTSRDSRGVYIDNIFYAMVPQEGVGSYYDENYANGEIFEMTMSIPIGEHHSYYFEFIDEQGAINHTPVYDGPRVVVGFPDLRVVSYKEEPEISASPVSPGYDDRFNYVVSTEIENPSDFSVNKPFWVSFEFFHADRTTGVYYLEDTVYAEMDHLYDHSQEPLSIGYEPFYMGEYMVVLTVDCDWEVLEIVDNNDTKTNNVAVHYFSVGPDLVVMNRDVQPSVGYVNRAYHLSVKVYNVGPTTAYFRPDEPLEVSFTIDNRTYFDEIYDPIEPGCYAVAVNDSFMSLVVGDFILTVKADPDGVVQESAELGTYNNNNEGFKMVSIIKRVGATSSTSFSPSLILVLCGLFFVSLLGITGTRKSD